MLQTFHTNGEAAQACYLDSTTPNTWECQSFTPFRSYSSSSIKLKAYRSAAGAGTVTVSLRAVSGELPTGADLAYGSFDASVLGTSSPGDWVTITLNTAVALTVGTRYEIVIRGALSAGYVYFRTSSTTNYAFGQRGYSTNAGSSWNDYAGDTSDVVFKIYDSETYSAQVIFVGGDVSGGKHLWKLIDDGSESAPTVEDSYTLAGNVTALAFSSATRKLYIAIGTSVYCYDADTITLDTSWASSGIYDVGKTVNDIAVDSSDNLAIAHNCLATSPNDVVTLLDNTGSLVWVAGGQNLGAFSGLNGLRVDFTLSGNINAGISAASTLYKLLVRLDITDGSILQTYTNGTLGGSDNPYAIVSSEDTETQCFLGHNTTDLWDDAVKSWTVAHAIPSNGALIHFADLDILYASGGSTLYLYYDADGVASHPWALYGSISITPNWSGGAPGRSAKNNNAELYLISSTGYFGTMSMPGSVRTSVRPSTAQLKTIAWAGNDQIPPTITSQSHTGNVDETYGDDITFSVTATGDPTPTYQWYKDSNPISGELSSSITIASIEASDGGTYYCIATNDAGSDQSADIVLRVIPYVTSQSTSTSFALNSENSLAVTATGSPLPTYQWYRDGIPVSGEISSVFTKYWGSADAGTYKCRITNEAGYVDSSDIVITIVANPYSFNLFNIPFDIDRETS